MTAACLLVRSPACSARQLQTSIVQVVHLCPTGFRKEPCERLERHKPKGLRVVLRGLGSSNAPRLPGGGGGDVTSLPDPAAGRVLRGGGSECCSCRIGVARQSPGDALKITEVGPFIRVLGVFPQFDKRFASRLVVAVLKCGNGLSGNDRRRGADRGPSSNRRWQHSGWIGGGGNAACGVGRLEQARGRACSNHKRKSNPQVSPASSRHHASNHPAISWCHEEILPM